MLIERRAERDLRRLPDDMFRRVAVALRTLADNARSTGCRKLSGSKNDWRVRVGDYRILYEIDDGEATVRVMRIRHRRDAYR